VVRRAYFAADSIERGCFGSRWRKVGGKMENSGSRVRAEAKTRRRVIGLIGNCQTELLYRALCHVLGDTEYECFYHFYEIPPEQEIQARDEIARCDDLLVQDIRNIEEYPLLADIRSDTRMSRFPVLWFAAPWPYDDFNGLRDSIARAQDDPSLHTTTYYDGALAKLRRSKPDPEARIAAYRALDVPGIVSPQRVLDFETRRLEAQDARFDMGIGRYILEHFRDEPLFHTVNRPNGFVLAMLLRHLLGLLQIDVALPALPELDELQTIQVPIHPKVAETLQLRWADSKRCYRVLDEPTDWEGYVRGYIARYS
jgi:Polysaccharide biosynthesis enzyme WcbI